jgi:hypothetical protein
MTEKELQNQIVYTLRILGYTVLESGKGRSKTQCANCKSWFYPKGWQGNTIGLPDLYIHNKKWGNSIGFAVELKTKKGIVREEQKILAEDNITTICRSLDDVLVALSKSEATIGSPETQLKLQRFIDNEYRTH